VRKGRVSEYERLYRRKKKRRKRKIENGKQRKSDSVPVRVRVSV
jgi:hypothetical protein